MTPIIYFSRSRTGARALVILARQLCGLLNRWHRILLEASGNDPSVSAAIEAALAACMILEKTLNERLEREFTNSPL
jgi:hypothetical protein